MSACLLKLVHSVDVVFNHLAEESATANLHSWTECMLRVLREQKSLGYLAPCLFRVCCAKNAFCMVFADNAAMAARACAEATSSASSCGAASTREGSGAAG